LDVVRGNGVVHRDVKPRNILVVAVDSGKAQSAAAAEASACSATWASALPARRFARSTTAPPGFRRLHWPIGDCISFVVTLQCRSGLTASNTISQARSQPRRCWMGGMMW
jgi:serine/threonine protein kinase